MKVLGRNILDKFCKKHGNANRVISAWLLEVETARWNSPQDIKDRFHSADFLSQNRVIFNIKGNHYRLVVEVRYQNGIVVVDWVGTHAEYDKQSF